jgi:formate dehydrogenase gamma subunit
MRYGMLIDLDDCIGCSACVSSCKEQWDVAPAATRNWVRSFESGTRGDGLAIAFYPGLCMQCETHPCTVDCPTGATYVDGNGVVVVDAAVCIGCGNCISTCPYGARSIDPVKGIIEKCNLCAPLVARGVEPVCVTTCLAECRIFGDLDDPASAVSTAVASRNAKPLVTGDINTRPKVFYAGAAARGIVLDAGTVKHPRPSWLTKTWSGVTRPLAQFAIPLVPALAIGGGIVANVIERRNRVAREERPEASDVIPRHRLAMRMLHWFNALSWILLLVTGTALMSAESFALFGTAIPRTIASWFGGTARLLQYHVLWGLLWSAVIVPLFLLYKRGGREAIEEVRLGRDDLVWMLRKPLVMLRLAREPLPPQHKYNAGQKIFAITAILGTATIIATGLVMAFHLGSATMVVAAILIHKLAVGFAIAGLGVHLTMAAVIREERPALRSMIGGTIDRAHADEHNRLWVEQHDTEKR